MIDQRVSRRSFVKAFGASALGLGLVACGNGSGDVDPNGGTEPGSTDGAVVAESAAYGEPWLASIAEGVVTADLAKPDLKDDLYLNVNYEWLRDKEIPTGYESIGSRADVLEAVNDRVAGLILDKTIAGREAEMVREYYGMFLDWDSRARGKEYFLEHLEPIQSIDSMDALSDYLGGEDSLYCGVGMMDLLLDKHQERPGEWMLRIRTTPMTLDDSGEYAGDAHTKTFDADCASYVLQYAGYGEEEATKLVEQGYAFEKLLGSPPSSRRSRRPTASSPATACTLTPRTASPFGACPTTPCKWNRVEQGTG